MVQTTKTISFTQELDEELSNTVEKLKKTQIKGVITKSKIIRLAVEDYLEKLRDIIKIKNKPINIDKIEDGE